MLLLAWLGAWLLSRPLTPSRRSGGGWQARSRRRSQLTDFDRAELAHQQELVRKRFDQEARAKEVAESFRRDMEEAAVRLKRWAAWRARAADAPWRHVEAAAQLVEAELARDALTVARARLRKGTTLDQAISDALEAVEADIETVTERLHLQTDWSTWTSAGPIGAAERDQAVRRRIAALRAKAESTEFPAEAAAFAAKADELATQHGILA